MTKAGDAMRSDSGAGFPTSVAEMELDDSDKLHVKQNCDAINGDFKDELGSKSIRSPISVGGGTSYNDIAEAHFERMGNMGSAFLEVPKKASASTIVSNFKNVQGSLSVESEIDAENCARLEKMSAEEIAQAQAEIMEKMDPALLNLLKKRGQVKLKRQKCSSSVIATTDEICNIQSENQSNSANISSGLESDNLQIVTSSTSKDTQNRLDNGVVQNSVSASSSLWEAWSARVEAVRELKFSLDGTVIENDFVPAPETGGISVDKRRSVDNAAERDFLRTEGDPGAAGYTIIEAVALTRSVVPGQRALAVHLLASVLNKALHNICRNQVGFIMRNDNNVDRSTVWEAVWAFALGPEPELVLALRQNQQQLWKNASFLHLLQ